MAGQYLDPYVDIRRDQWQQRRSFDQQSSRSADARYVGNGRSSFQSDDSNEFDDRWNARRSIHIEPQHQANDVYYTSGNPYEASANLRRVSQDQHQTLDWQGQRAVYHGNEAQPQQFHNTYQQWPTAYPPQGGNIPTRPFSHFGHNQQPQQPPVPQQTFYQLPPQQPPLQHLPPQQLPPQQSAPQRLPNNQYTQPEQAFQVPLRAYHCESLEAIRGGRCYISPVPGLVGFVACPKCYAELIYKARLGNYFEEARCRQPGLPCDMANIAVRRLWSDTVQLSTATSNLVVLLGQFGNNTKKAKASIQQLKNNLQDLHKEIQDDERQQDFAKRMEQMEVAQAYALRRKGQPAKYNKLAAAKWESMIPDYKTHKEQREKRDKYTELVATLKSQTDFTVQYAGCPRPKRQRPVGEAKKSLFDRFFGGLF